MDTPSLRVPARRPRRDPGSGLALRTAARVDTAARGPSWRWKAQYIACTALEGSGPRLQLAGPCSFRAQRGRSEEGGNGCRVRIVHKMMARTDGNAIKHLWARLLKLTVLAAGGNLDLPPRNSTLPLLFACGSGIARREEGLCIGERFRYSVAVATRRFAEYMRRCGPEYDARQRRSWA